MSNWEIREVGSGSGCGDAGNGGAVSSNPRRCKFTIYRDQQQKHEFTTYNIRINLLQTTSV